MEHDALGNKKLLISIMLCFRFGINMLHNLFFKLTTNIFIDLTYLEMFFSYFLDLKKLNVTKTSHEA